MLLPGLDIAVHRLATDRFAHRFAQRGFDLPAGPGSASGNQRDLVVEIDEAMNDELLKQGSSAGAGPVGRAILAIGPRTISFVLRVMDLSKARNSRNTAACWTAPNGRRWRPAARGNHGGKDRTGIERTRGLAVPEEKTPTGDGWRFANDVPGGPGRNRTTDTRFSRPVWGLVAKTPVLLLYR